ncbi:MAG: histone deacetylase [Bernardetiaceae bacterium]
MLKIAFSPIYILPLPEKHRFPMQKYGLLPEQLRYEGTAQAENFFCPEPLSSEVILQTHAPAYWDKLQHQRLSKIEERRMGFPLTHTLIQREITILDGTLQSALFALEYGVAFNIAGGTHHAYADRGEGFCVLNDIAVAANYLRFELGIRRVLVLDLDVHQGNGTAKIFENVPEVFTFSMHGERNFPIPKEQSDWDIGLPDQTEDADYLRLLDEALEELSVALRPEFVFFQAGVDVLATDKLGKLALSLWGCRERDLRVFRWCKRHGFPVAVSMGGGYSARIADIVEAHANTYRVARELYF